VAEINLPNKSTEMLYAVHTAKAETTPREHLGASVIGGECMRKFWLNFRWVKRENFDGRMLRLFETGHLAEERIIKELRDAGCEVICEEDGNQLRFKEFGGHFAGSIDGAVLGVPEAPKTWHLLECKTANDNNFQKIESKGVRKAKPEHFAQMQVYMHFLKLKRALYVCVNKNTDEIYTERVYYEKEEAQKQIERAREIVFSPLPPPVLEQKQFGPCHFCHLKNNCHKLTEELPAMNCRTCIRSTAKDDGSWHCEKHNKTLTKEDQLAGCTDHLFIPDTVPMKLLEVIEGEGEIAIVYQSLINGEKYWNHENTVGDKFCKEPF
jgi:hypothetical protein